MASGVRSDRRELDHIANAEWKCGQVKSENILLTSRIAPEVDVGRDRWLIV